MLVETVRGSVGLAKSYFFIPNPGIKPASLRSPAIAGNTLGWEDPLQ